ncbi:unnamed protein product [Gongylonema pulchrum]|uniref:Uncharacterized protein n=1 Tax=Gongylonema pulchrum TaxID=637853 RepID=A0A183EV79_9BILA|nr:unnamed protein product [Gongylonema pulchrum]
MSGELYCSVSCAKQGFSEVNAPQQRVKRAFQRNQQESNGKSSNFELVPRALRLCSDEAFENDIRLLALRKRYEQKSGAKKPIPLLSTEIEQQSLVPSRISNQFDYKTSIDKQRALSARYALMIRNRLREQMVLEQRMATVQDLVHEQPIPTFLSSFGGMFFSPTQTSRKLKPTRQPTIRHQVYTFTPKKHYS